MTEESQTDKNLWFLGSVAEDGGRDTDTLRMAFLPMDGAGAVTKDSVVITGDMTRLAGRDVIKAVPLPDAPHNSKTHEMDFVTASDGKAIIAKLSGGTPRSRHAYAKDVANHPDITSHSAIGSMLTTFAGNQSKPPAQSAILVSDMPMTAEGTTPGAGEKYNSLFIAIAQPSRDPEWQKAINSSLQSALERSIPSANSRQMVSPPLQQDVSITSDTSVPVSLVPIPHDRNRFVDLLNQIRKEGVAIPAEAGGHLVAQTGHHIFRPRRYSLGESNIKHDAANNTVSIEVPVDMRDPDRIVSQIEKTAAWLTDPKTGADIAQYGVTQNSITVDHPSFSNSAGKDGVATINIHDVMPLEQKKVVQALEIAKATDSGMFAEVNTGSTSLGPVPKTPFNNKQQARNHLGGMVLASAVASSAAAMASAGMPLLAATTALVGTAVGIKTLLSMSQSNKDLFHTLPVAESHSKPLGFTDAAKAYATDPKQRQVMNKSIQLAAGDVWKKAAWGGGATALAAAFMDSNPLTVGVFLVAVGTAVAGMGARLMAGDKSHQESLKTEVNNDITRRDDAWKR